MTLKRNWRNQIRGWLPKEPVLPLPIKVTTANRRIVDKKLLVGTITVSLIIAVFGALVYSTFSQPIVYQYHTRVNYYIKEPIIEESLKPYVGVYMTRGIFNGTVDWLGGKEVNLHVTSYACIVDRNYDDQGHLWSVTVEEHVAVSQNKFVLPNETIGYQEAVIPILDTNTRHYVFTFDFPLTVNGIETWPAT